MNRKWYKLRLRGLISGTNSDIWKVKTKKNQVEHPELLEFKSTIQLDIC
jgi:hypothetical protein